MSLPACRRSTAFTDKKTIGPRFGFAWSPGGGRTVVRGGYGIYFDQRTAQVFQQLRSNPPITAVQTLNFAAGGVSDGWVYRVQGLDPTALPVPTATTSFTLRAIEKDPKTDTAQQWNLDLQRELPGRIVVQAAYVGTHGTHLFLQRNINYARPDAAGVFSRPFVGLWRHLVSGQQRQLDLPLRPVHRAETLLRRLAVPGGLHAFPRPSTTRRGTSRYFVNAGGDPNNFRRNRGLSTFDRPQRLTLSFNLAVPNPLAEERRPPSGMCLRAGRFPVWDCCNPAFRSPSPTRSAGRPGTAISAAAARASRITWAAPRTPAGATKRAVERLSGEERLRRGAAHALRHAGPQRVAGPGPGQPRFRRAEAVSVRERLGLNSGPSSSTSSTTPTSRIRAAVSIRAPSA